MKLLTIIGARPQFIKASALSSALKNINSLKKINASDTLIATADV